MSAPLGSSRAFVCFLHTSLQGTGFCEKAQGSSLRRCYSAHMSPITLTPNWIWTFAQERSHPDWFCGYRPLALVLLNHPSNLFDICPPLTPETLTLREELEYLHLTTCPTLTLLGSAPQQLEESFLISIGWSLPLHLIFIFLVTVAYNKYAQALMFCSSAGSLDLFLKLFQHLDFSAVISQRIKKVCF